MLSKKTLGERRNKNLTIFIPPRGNDVEKTVSFEVKKNSPMVTLPKDDKENSEVSEELTTLVRFSSMIMRTDSQEHDINLMVVKVVLTELGHNLPKNAVMEKPNKLGFFAQKLSWLHKKEKNNSIPALSKNCR